MQHSLKHLHGFHAGLGMHRCLIAMKANGRAGLPLLSTNSCRSGVATVARASCYGLGRFANVSKTSPLKVPRAWNPLKSGIRLGPRRFNSASKSVFSLTSSVAEIETNNAEASSNRSHVSEVFNCLLGCSCVALACWQVCAGQQSTNASPLPFASVTLPASVTVDSRAGAEQKKTRVRNHRSVARYMKYSTLKVFQQPVLVKVLMVVAMAIPISIIGGLLYKAVTGTELKASIFKSYHTWANSPGIDVVNEETPSAALIVNTLFVCGLLSFAVILGIITDEISDAVQQMRTGNYDIVETNHTVILGWNPMVLPVLRQLSVNVEERGSKAIPQPIVILSDLPKEDMDSKLREENLSSLVVITRTGSPTRTSDLEKVSATTADTIIVLNPEGYSQREGAVQKAAALMALESISTTEYRAVLVQGTNRVSSHEYLPTDAVTDRWQRSRNEPLLLVPRLERSAQLLAQCALEPGLSKVFTGLLVQSFDTAEFYVTELPKSLEGSIYQQARRSFTEATLCGIVTAEGKLEVNPAEDLVLQAKSKLVFVALNESNIQPLPAPYEVGQYDHGSRRLGKDDSSNVRSVAVLCYGGDPMPVVRNLQEFSKPGTRVTLITDQTEGLRMPCRRNGVSVRLVAGNPMSGAVLHDANVQEVDSVILCGADSLGDNADAQVVGSVLQLQGLRARTNIAHSQNVVVVVTHPGSQQVLEHINATEWPGLATSHPLRVEPLNADQLVSGMLAQVTADVSLHYVFDELFRNSGGCEIYLRSAKMYHLPNNVTLPWEQVVEAVRSYGQTVIGYVPHESEPVMCPSPCTQVTLSPNDRLVVIAEN